VNRSPRRFGRGLSWRRSIRSAEITRRWARWPGVATADLLRLLALLRRKNRVQRPAGPADDGIELGLNRASDRAQLAALTIHDGVDPGLLLW
jgi:hypothetical protein